MRRELGVRTAAVVASLAASAITLALADGRAAVNQTRLQDTCYPAQFTAFLARRIMIVDSVARLRLVVTRPIEVCAPAKLEGASSSNASLYLTCYEIRAPSIGRRSLGLVSNTLGTVRLIVDSPRKLCVSSSPTSKPATALRLTCYAVVSPQTNKSTKKNIADRFGTARESLAVGRPVSFCTRSRGASAPSLHLVCYAVASHITASALVLTDEWGVLRASLGRRNRLCIQSSLK